MRAGETYQRGDEWKQYRTQEYERPQSQWLRPRRSAALPVVPHCCPRGRAVRSASTFPQCPSTIHAACFVCSHCVARISIQQQQLKYRIRRLLTWQMHFAKSAVSQECRSRAVYDSSRGSSDEREVKGKWCETRGRVPKTEVLKVLTPAVRRSAPIEEEARFHK